MALINADKLKTRLPFSIDTVPDGPDDNVQPSVGVANDWLWLYLTMENHFGVDKVIIDLFLASRRRRRGSLDFELFELVCDVPQTIAFGNELLSECYLREDERDQLWKVEEAHDALRPKRRSP